ncbi:MFS transporter [Neobacillus sp. YX16]|uniref:MFS transporter n=1 Tax=Neobacillus sp. YX16 TaxID=3047874 RepID=UPI0024C25907|nr:MFS transporter [Neobacillus sp. YX16]WHZ00894.1 MFS transporter [Neobacillus sp. YX16]
MKEGKKENQAIKATTSSVIGSTIEWYDFHIYGLTAALVFPALFFPSSDPLIGTIESLATFTLGFIARPVGGIIFGHFGDKIGRKSILAITLLLMGFATFIIGLLPTYETIGGWAPILLIALRLIQGIAVGGEWGGAILVTIEHAPHNKRGLYGSWPQMGGPLGLFIATLVFTIVSSLPERQFLSWGWRVPFLASILLVTIGLFIRLKLAETPEFQKLKDSRKVSKTPILEVLKFHKKALIQVMGARFAESGTYFIFSMFVLTYTTTQLGLPRSVAVSGVMIATILEVIAIPLFGRLSDKIGRRPVYMGGAIFTALFVFPFFWLLDTKTTPLIWLAIVLGLAIGHAAMYGPQAAFFSEMFGANVRYSGISLGYQLSSILAGGLAPIVATFLLSWSAGKSWLVALYALGMALITIYSIYFTKETNNKNTLATNNTNKDKVSVSVKSTHRSSM